MTFIKVHPEKLPASLLWLMFAGCALSGCVGSELRTVTPPNAPPDISHRMPADDAPPHQGISIGGRGYFGHVIIAPADGLVVYSEGNHVRIHHGLDSTRQDIYTDHFHVHGPLVKESGRVIRGQTLGLIGVGKNTSLPHYHYVVIKKGGPGTFIALDSINYWFGIDQYKEKLEKGLDVGPFQISCFDANANYPKEPLRFTYPVKCE